MSRYCPKQNHLFINWLKSNRSRFLFEPYITKISKLTITGYFGGISSPIRFHVYRGNHIDVVVCFNSKISGYIGEFLLLEKLGKNGYCADWFDPDNYHYHPSRADLWINECFEPFLEWSNENLATAKWLALYSDEDVDYTITRLQDSESPTVNMTLTKLLQVRQSLRVQRPELRHSYSF